MIALIARVGWTRPQSVASTPAFTKLPNHPIRWSYCLDVDCCSMHMQCMVHTYNLLPTDAAEAAAAELAVVRARLSPILVAVGAQFAQENIYILYASTSTRCKQAKHSHSSFSFSIMSFSFYYLLQTLPNIWCVLCVTSTYAPTKHHLAQNYIGKYFPSVGDIYRCLWASRAIVVFSVILSHTTICLGISIGFVPLVD